MVIFITAITFHRLVADVYVLKKIVLLKSSFMSSAQPPGVSSWEIKKKKRGIFQIKCKKMFFSFIARYCSLSLIVLLLFELSESLLIKLTYINQIKSLHRRQKSSSRMAVYSKIKPRRCQFFALKGCANLCGQVIGKW